MGRDVTVLRLIGMRSPKTDSGFILPVAIGVGLVMILLGIIIINRSMQNRFTAIAQKQTSQSQAAAEAGIAQLQSLFNRYPPLATYSSTNWNSLSDTVLAPNSCTASPTTTEASDLVEDYANDVTDNEWKLIHTNPDEGQFRLVSYTYIPKNTSSTSPTAPRGELIVEGRVRAATARLKVQFEITHPFPGLWINSNSDASASDSVQLKTNILDSTCPAATNYASNIANLKAYMPNNPPPLPRYNYRASPGEPFPSLPLEGFNSTSIGSNSYPIFPIVGNQTLPRPEDISSNGVFIYRVANVAGQSIRLSSNSTLEVASGNKTVVLYLEGGLSISDRSKIKLTSGSKLIIYTHGSVTMSGNSTDPLIEQDSATAASGNVQLYVYPPDLSTPPTPPHNVQINGGTEMSMVLFAPESEVTINSSTTVKGMIWAKAWNGSQDAAIAESKPNLLDLKLIPPPRISPITSWERVSNP
jgi:Tfp pilus assembly protein PilX